METCLSNEQYQTLYTQYNQPYREYHNWNHIASIINQVKSSGFEISIAQYLAILYHDCIYQVGKFDNEERSAQFLLDNVKLPEAGKAAEMILASAYHIHDQQVDEETGLFLDLDIYELATDNYTKNMIAIRKEYAKSGGTNWVDGRIIFLSAMLDRKKLFYTEFFDEQRARFNIGLELQTLKFL